MTADAKNFNNLLEKCILNNFQHRLILRLTTVHNKVNIEQVPKPLKDLIIMNVNTNKEEYNLRNKL
jgi:hypothetical protein